MEIYFTNPITLIICKSIFNEKVYRAILVLPYTRTKIPLENFYERQEALIEISSIFCEFLNYEFSTITREEFTKKKPQIIETTLNRKNMKSNPIVIFQASDVYSSLGFSNYFLYPLTKIKLRTLFRRGFNFNNNKYIYIYNISNIKVYKKNIKKIDEIKVKNILESVSKKYFAESLTLGIESLSSDCILILPPISKNTGGDFTNKFLKKALDSAKDKNKTIIIKPHYNDETNYRELALAFGIQQEIIELPKHIPVELYFPLINIEEIISIPSSSLVLANRFKLTVYVSKKPQEFRKYFLDQSNYLRFIGIKVIKL